MAGRKRPAARIAGEQLARAASMRAGDAVRAARVRRRTRQASLAAQAGMSQARLSAIESGAGAGAPLEAWFALAKALDLYLRFEFGRDPQAELRDAGHLAMQELVLRAAALAGWRGTMEAATRAYEPGRSIDVRLLDAQRRRIVIVECWNTFGDLGGAVRSSDRKQTDELERAVAAAGGGRPFQVGLCWVVRDTAANRALVARYEHIFASRFPGSSVAWIRALTYEATDEATDMPGQPGLIWCDGRATRLFARRRAARSR